MAKNALSQMNIAAVDIGSSKIACLVGCSGKEGKLEVLAHSYYRSEGIKNGQIFDLDLARDCIAKAIVEAELSVGEIDSVVVNAPVNQLSSLNFASELTVAGHAIMDNDINKLIERCASHFNEDDQQIIHCIPTSYHIDAMEHVEQPRGMYGEKLGVHLNIISANKWHLKNLETVMNDIHIGVNAVVAAPYASAQACIVPYEKDLGAVLVDMGAGTTSICVFLNSQVVYANVIPVGGFNITKDIAQYFTISLSQAEMLKNREGSAFLIAADSQKIINVPAVEGDDIGIPIKKSELINIIVMRVEEILELVKENLREQGLYDLPSKRLILTGGASRLQGIKEVASAILDRNIRLGAPVDMEGLPAKLCGGDMSTCCGLLRFAMANPDILKKKKEFIFKKNKFFKWFLHNF